MSRVEWTRLHGDDVEAVVAMFVNREHVGSVRITPSRGDGGVDILDRGAAPDGRDEVYQVKRYTSPLDSKQKNEVASSLDTLLRDERWADLDVATWRLVTPWDPTPEAEAWLQGLGHIHGVTPIWHGLTYSDQMAARYPDVVDYYLHGGRSRVEEAYRSVVALMRVSDIEPELDVREVVTQIEAAVATLDVDPHYRYELRFGEGPMPDRADRPGLVMTWVRGTADDGRWSAVDVIARCAASVQERPITVKGHFTVAGDSPFANDLRAFVEFGAPFRSPPVYDGVIDAPGGLGGPIEGASVWTLPTAEQDLGENPELHVDLLNPEGDLIANIDIDRIDRSSGTSGLRAVFRETHGLLTIEDRYDLQNHRGSRSINVGEFAGTPIGAARSVMTFLVHCRSPNVGRMSVRHTPPELGIIDPNFAFSWPEDVEAALNAKAAVLDDLDVIQRNTAVPIRVPDFRDASDGQILSWSLVAQVLRGEQVSRTYPDGGALYIAFNDDEIPEPGETFTVPVPLSVTIGSQVIDLGSAALTLEDPTLVGSHIHGGVTYHGFTTPGRVVHYHRPGPPET